MNDPGAANRARPSARPRGSFTLRLACQELASICHSSRAARVSETGLPLSRVSRPLVVRRQQPTELASGLAHTRLGGIAMLVTNTAGHHVCQPDAEARRRQCASRAVERSARAFRAAWRALTAPSLRVSLGIYVMAESPPAGGKRQDRVAHRPESRPPQAPAGATRTRRVLTPVEHGASSKAAGRSPHRLHKLWTAGIDRDPQTAYRGCISPVPLAPPSVVASARRSASSTAASAPRSTASTSARFRSKIDARRASIADRRSVFGIRRPAHPATGGALRDIAASPHVVTPVVIRGHGGRHEELVDCCRGRRVFGC